MYSIYSEEEKNKILEDFRESGKSAYGFCKLNKISITTLKRWLNAGKRDVFGLVYEKEKYDKNVITTGATIFKNDKISIELKEGWDKRILKQIMEMIIND